MNGGKKIPSTYTVQVFERKNHCHCLVTYLLPRQLVPVRHFHHETLIRYLELYMCLVAITITYRKYALIINRYMCSGVNKLIFSSEVEYLDDLIEVAQQ